MRSSALTSTGALCLVAAAPTFLAANVVVGLGWHDPAFSWATNNISDLGNVTCGVWDTTRPRYVCSPWHDAMNLAFVPTSLLLVSGLLLTRRAWGTGGTSRAARWMLLAGSAGFGLAGVAPADTHENLHLLAALLIFACGNLGLIMAGFARTGMLLSRLRPLTLVFGALGTAGSALFIAQQGLGLGVGGMERVAGLSMPVWICVVGAFLYHTTRAGDPTPRRPAAEGDHPGFS